MLTDISTLLHTGHHAPAIEGLCLRHDSGVHPPEGRGVGGNGVVVGLSGGIDSALVSKLCVDALGADKVLNIFMPVFLLLPIGPR